jgi:predicted aconitase with swiveling domain
MSASGETRKGRLLAVGAGRGDVVVLAEPLSLWGGLDPKTGIVIDPHHPQAGQSLAGRVVLMPSGRGSSSSSSILAEAIRAQTAPAAFILLEPDPILALGAIVAAELYGRTVPVVVVDQGAYEAIAASAHATVDATGDGATIQFGLGR